MPHAVETSQAATEMEPCMAEKKQHIRSRKNGTEATAPPSNIYNNFSYKDIARSYPYLYNALRTPRDWAAVRWRWRCVREHILPRL